MNARNSDGYLMPGKGTTGMAMKASLGLSALCIICLVLGSPLARANVVSATASAGPTEVGCGYGSTSNGGSGFASASTGPVSCAYLNPFFGGTISSTASASGSWVTGDFSTSAVAAANPVGNSIDAIGENVFYDAGLVTLPPGMVSAQITFGVTGLSGFASAGPAAPSGGASAANIIMLSMTAGGSSGTSGTSEACLNVNAYVTGCPGGGFGLGFGPGALAPITLTVYNGDYLQLNVTVESTAFANAYVAPEGANASINVDPLYLDLPTGATFDSGVTGFLSGAPPTAVPEPSSLLMLGTGLLGLMGAARRK
jgi:hypothetical protein